VSDQQPTKQLGNFVATTGQKPWPPVGTFVAAHGQFSMAVVTLPRHPLVDPYVMAESCGAANPRRQTRGDHPRSFGTTRGHRGLTFANSDPWNARTVTCLQGPS
jgi:hypothetical protein